MWIYGLYQSGACGVRDGGSRGNRDCDLSDLYRAFHTLGLGGIRKLCLGIPLQSAGIGVFRCHFFGTASWIHAGCGWGGTTGSCDRVFYFAEQSVRPAVYRAAFLDVAAGDFSWRAVFVDGNTECFGNGVCSGFVT